MKLFCILFLLLASSYIYPQVDMNYEILNYMATREADPDPNDREGIKRQFQTHFIKEVFLNNVFKSQHLFYDESDKSHEYDIVNQIIINEFANQIVDSKAIDLSHITFDE